MDTTPPPRRALNASEIVSGLARLEGWSLSGEGANLAIEKRFAFADYHATMAFVNAVAFIAHRRDHHPELAVHFNHCVVRWRTHDVRGISGADLACAAQVDALLAEGPP